MIFGMNLSCYNAYKYDAVNELPVHSFIFQHSRRHFQNFY